MQDGSEQSGRTQSPAVTRAFAVLDAVAAAQQPIGLSALARELGIAKSSVSNLCNALVEVSALTRTDRGYTLGRRLAELGGAFLATVDEVGEFHRVCEEFAPDLEETVQLATLGEGLDVVYLARRDGRQPVRLASDVGRRLPASCTAVGKAMLAELAEAELDQRLAGRRGLPVLTRRSIDSPLALRLELERTRERGYAVDDEEVADAVLCVGVALPNNGYATARMGVSVTMLKARASEDHLAHVSRVLRRLAARLAGTEPPAESG